MPESRLFAVTGMKCGGCESNIVNNLQELEGVLSVCASAKEQTVEVRFAPELIDEDVIINAIEELGFAVEDD